MKTLFISLILFFFTITISIDSFAFPKKKKALFQDTIIDSSLEEDLSIAGYYNSIMFLCNYALVKNNKEYLKNLKGFIGYINWDLFKFFNKGSSLLETQMYAAGIGWGANTGSFSEGSIPFTYGIKGCDSNSIKMAEENNLNVPENLLFPFIKKKSNNNYLEQLEILKNKLLSDKRDDYNIFISTIEKGKSILENNVQKTNVDDKDETVSEEEDIVVNEDDDIITQLEKLKSLFEADLISNEEYDEKRKEILDKM